MLFNASGMPKFLSQALLLESLIKKFCYQEWFQEAGTKDGMLEQWNIITGGQWSIDRP